MADRNWFDSFPGVDLDDTHPILDPYGTPYSGYESFQFPGKYEPFDAEKDPHAPYATVSQNRGGIA